ncbi:hypothetical protein [Hafnia paralvei]|uniref:hypothetical protein n=1 Tax=Hafnia paralvei TaxID=546367 RepID=UPI003C30E7EF
MKTKIISNLADIMFLCCLAYGIYQPESGFTNIAMAYAWVVILLGVAISFAAFIFSAIIETLSTEKKKTVIGQLKKAFEGNKRSFFGKAFRFARIILVIAAISYVGWVFTAVAYSLAVLALLIAKGLLKSSVENYEKSAA